VRRPPERGRIGLPGAMFVYRQGHGMNDRYALPTLDTQMFLSAGAVDRINKSQSKTVARETSLKEFRR
jgi:hypothetical protein